MADAKPAPKKSKPLTADEKAVLLKLRERPTGATGDVLGRDLVMAQAGVWTAVNGLVVRGLAKRAKGSVVIMTPAGQSWADGLLANS